MRFRRTRAHPRASTVRVAARHALPIALAAALALLVAACGQSASVTSPATTAAPSPRPASPSAGAAVPRLAHVVLIVMENRSASQVVGSAQAPFITRLAHRYSLAAGYSALFHPSLPNYIALTSGSNQGITDDRSPPTAGYAVAARNLADTIEASGLTWRSYAESIPAPGYARGDTALYATRHVPFLYYRDVLDDARRRTSHVVPLTRLAADLGTAAATPAFSFITPNLCNDMHSCPTQVGDAWLARWVPRILASPAFRSSPSLLVVTFDEGVGADQHVATILAGSAAKRHYRSSRPYDHYSLLHTIEAALRLPTLTGNDARAATMGEFLR
jgi:phosphatidylinositol-3-phosphatase